MSDANAGFGTLIEPTTFTIQRWLPGPIERIWDYLTDAELRSKWLAAGDMPLSTGAGFELVWRNDDLSRPDDRRPEGFSEEQRMQSTVISVDAPNQLVIAWGSGEVSFELQAKGDRVMMTLIHTGLGMDSRTQIAAGWHTHLEILEATVEGREPASFWSTWAQHQAAYKAQIA